MKLLIFNVVVLTIGCGQDEQKDYQPPPYEENSHCISCNYTEEKRPEQEDVGESIQIRPKELQFYCTNESIKCDNEQSIYVFNFTNNEVVVGPIAIVNDPEWKGKSDINEFVILDGAMQTTLKIGEAKEIRIMFVWDFETVSAILNVPTSLELFQVPMIGKFFVL